MFDENTFLEARLTENQAKLSLVDSAIAAVLSGAQSYSLDSGQTRQTVTRASLGQLQALKTHYENEILKISRRLCGGATVAQPGW